MPLVFEVVFFNFCNNTDRVYIGGAGAGGSGVGGGGGWGAVGRVKQTFKCKEQCLAISK